MLPIGKFVAVAIATVALSSCRLPDLIVEACEQDGRTGFHISMPDNETVKIDSIAVGKEEPGTVFLTHVWAAYTPTDARYHHPLRSDVLIYGHVPEGWRGDDRTPPLEKGSSYEIRVKGEGREGSTILHYGEPLLSCDQL